MPGDDERHETVRHAARGGVPAEFEHWNVGRRPPGSLNSSEGHARYTTGQGA